MHEMALCESLRSAIEEAAVRERFSKVARVRLAIGRFAGVEVEALRFGFDIVMAGSPAEGAELVVLEEEGTGWCFDCCETVPLAHRLAPCPRCGGERLVPNGGTEMKIKDLEVT
ncbi:hydrogenase maturation nickel metallochaperone HypA/HybF [Xanthobacter pseudotagetidis]|uniref:hydrogenase maturation nickel metallochaperone HypA/HybF n=1 Tax=Xanthobacter pseudotagetidis TaxID=3119911 RepID=UPI00372870C9